MFKFVLEKAEEPEVKLPISTGSFKKQESSGKTYTSVLLTMPKPLTVCTTTNCGKVLQEMGIPGHLNCLPGGSEVKASVCNAGDLGWIPRSGRSPGEGNGNPWRISWTEEPGRLQSTGSKRVGQN